MNSEPSIFLTNISYDLFFNWQTEKKKLVWTNKKFVFFSNFPNLGKHDLLVDPMSSFMDIVSHWTGGSEVKLQLFEKLTFLENIFKKN